MDGSNIHKKLAVKCFNDVWALLDKEDRTEEENMEMIHTAHCSRYHWGEIGTPLEFQRGEWQISRVYSTLGLGQSALYHGEACHGICRENNIGDFDYAFSLEALARACEVLGLREESQRYMSQAKKAASLIEEKENRDYFLGELSSIS